MKLTENMTNMLARIYRLTVTEKHYDYTAADIHKATLKALITRGFVVVTPKMSVVVTDAGLGVLGVEQDKPTADETAPLPARTLREQYEGTAARFNPAVIDELHEQASAIDEKRTIARAYLCAPDDVVLTWDEIQRGYLDAMAERDWIEHNQAVRAQTERVPEQLDGSPTEASKSSIAAAKDARRLHVGDRVRGKRTGRLGRVTYVASGVAYVTPDEGSDKLVGRFSAFEKVAAEWPVISSDKWAAAVDEPRDLDIWLQPGVVLVGPQSGDRYWFLRWDGGWAVVRHEADGTEMRIVQDDVVTWKYLPKASAAGVAAAKRRVPWRETFVMHERTGQRYRVLGMDNIRTGKLIISHDCGSKCSEHERAISPDVLLWDYVACDENGNVQPLPSAAFAAFEDITPADRVPDTRESRKTYAERLKAAEERLGKVLSDIENLAVCWDTMSTRFGVIPKAPWAALRSIVKENQ